MTAAPVLALIPANRLDRAKGRLAQAYTPGLRAALALATLRTVVEAAAVACERAIVLTADDRARAAAAAAGAETLAEVEGVSGLNGQLEAALARLESPAGGVLILHADLPLATAEALRTFLAAAPGRNSATLQPSRDGGTNAMLLRPPERFGLAYGPGSFDLHVAAAAAAGLVVTRTDIPELALDLDTPADVMAFLALPGAGTTAAGRLLAQAHEAGRR